MYSTTDLYYFVTKRLIGKGNSITPIPDTTHKRNSKSAGRIHYNWVANT
jgi:hypothetical protein